MSTWLKYQPSTSSSSRCLPSLCGRPWQWSCSQRAPLFVTRKLWAQRSSPVWSSPSLSRSQNPTDIQKQTVEIHVAIMTPIMRRCAKDWFQWSSNVGTPIFLAPQPSASEMHSLTHMDQRRWRMWTLSMEKHLPTLRTQDIMTATCSSSGRGFPKSFWFTSISPTSSERLSKPLLYIDSGKKGRKEKQTSCVK